MIAENTESTVSRSDLLGWINDLLRVNYYIVFTFAVEPY